MHTLLFADKLVQIPTPFPFQDLSTILKLYFKFTPLPNRPNPTLTRALARTLSRPEPGALAPICGVFGLLAKRILEKYTRLGLTNQVGLPHKCACGYALQRGAIELSGFVQHCCTAVRKITRAIPRSYGEHISFLIKKCVHRIIFCAVARFPR